MLLTSARSVPDIALASRLSSTASNFSVPLSFCTLTWPVRRCDNVPSGPLTMICSALMVASAPFGSAIGILPTRDILHSLSDVANHFATDTGCARFAVSHDASRRRHDRHTQTVHHVGNVVLALVNTQAGTGYALEALNHRTAGIVLEADLEFRLAGVLGNSKIFDITLILQHGGDSHLDLGRRHHNGGLLNTLRIADA